MSVGSPGRRDQYASLFEAEAGRGDVLVKAAPLLDIVVAWRAFLSESAAGGAELVNS